MRILALLLLILLCSSRPVAGWGSAGHRITGHIAARYYFDNDTLNAVTQLLGGHTWWDLTSQWPDGAIAYADYYARTNAGRWSYDLHFAYTNHMPYFTFATDCSNYCDSYLAALGYCVENQTLIDCCVVAAVEKYKSELWLQIVAGQQNNSAGLNNTNDVQLKLLLLAHLIGDLHQPLHVDLRSAWNGNDYYIQWYGNTTCTSSGYSSPCQLHEVWDTLLIEKRLLDFGPAPPPGSLDPREELFAESIINSLGGLCVVLGYNYDATYWASETVATAAMAYLIPEYSSLDDWYYNNSIPIVELQLYKAGRRIAQELNFIFSGYVKQCTWCQWWGPLCRPVSSIAQESAASLTKLGKFC